jgi:hypothetical protein
MEWHGLFCWFPYGDWANVRLPFAIDLVNGITIVSTGCAVHSKTVQIHVLGIHSLFLHLSIPVFLDTIECIPYCMMPHSSVTLLQNVYPCYPSFQTNEQAHGMYTQASESMVRQSISSQPMVILGNGIST